MPFLTVTESITSLDRSTASLRLIPTSANALLALVGKSFANWHEKVLPLHPSLPN